MPRGQYDRSKAKSSHPRWNIGGQMMNIEQIARQPWCKLKPTTIRHRLKAGMGIVEAVTIPKYETARRYEYKGKKRTLAYLSRLPECVVEYQTLWYRVKVLKLPVEWSMKTPPTKKGKGNSLEWKRQKAILQPIEMLIEEEERRYG